MSGLASGMTGVLWVNSGVPLAITIMAVMITDAMVGLLFGFFRNQFEMPSFVATLAGLLALLGMQLYIFGPTGSIKMPFTSPLVRFGQILIMLAWLSYSVALFPGVLIVLCNMLRNQQRSAVNLS